MKNFKMKSIKSLSLLIAIALLATIGGVYAAWSYASSAGVTETINKGVSLTPATQSGSIGSYEIGYTEFSVLLDQTAPGDYTPKLSFYFDPASGLDGSLNFKFIPFEVASDEAKENGVTSTVTFSSSLTHEGQAIFTFPQTITIGTADSSDAIKWTKQPDGSFTCEIANAELPNYIQLAYTDKLDTFAKYQDMETSLSNGSITITVSNNYTTP